MRARRIARRIASMGALENPRTDVGGSRTLVTKVFHQLFQSFLVCVGAGQWRTAERGMADAQGQRQRSSAGVWPSPRPWHTRRLASSAAPVSTPFATSTLVTKEGKNEVVS